jgi:hypothetical protein
MRLASCVCGSPRWPMYCCARFGTWRWVKRNSSIPAVAASTQAAQGRRAREHQRPPHHNCHGVCVSGRPDLGACCRPPGRRRKCSGLARPTRVAAECHPRCITSGPPRSIGCTSSQKSSEHPPRHVDATELCMEKCNLSGLRISPSWKDGVRYPGQSRVTDWPIRAAKQHGAVVAFGCQALAIDFLVCGQAKHGRTVLGLPGSMVTPGSLDHLAPCPHDLEGAGVLRLSDLRRLSECGEDLPREVSNG